MLVPVAALIAVLHAAPEPRRISLDVRDADIHNVLRLIADAAQLNIVVADEVKGRVTLKLRQVPWTEALDVILASKGLGRERDGDVLLVDTLERMAQRDALQAKRAAAAAEVAPLRTVLIPVSNAKAAELAPIVRALLTPRGNVAVDARTNTLIVTDEDRAVDRVRAAVGR